MKHRMLAAAILLILPYSLKGQELQLIQRQASTLPSDARFEMVQGGPGAQWTFRLDRVTGNVERLVSGKSGILVWQKMRVLPHPKAVNSTKPHFQIFVSSTSAQMTFLLDTDSGAAWQLVPNGDISLWQPIE